MLGENELSIIFTKRESVVFYKECDKNKQNSFLLRHLIFFCVLILCKSIISIRKWNFCYCFAKSAVVKFNSFFGAWRYFHINSNILFRWTYITIKRTVCTCLRECVPRSLLLPWSRPPLQQQKMMRKGSEFQKDGGRFFLECDYHST